MMNGRNRFTTILNRVSCQLNVTSVYKLYSNKHMRFHLIFSFFQPWLPYL